MTRAQRFVRIAIIACMPVLVLGAIGAIAGSLLFGFEQTRDISTIQSPTREYAATLVSGSGACERGDSANQSTRVVVERRWGVVKTGSFVPFCVNKGAAHVLVAWDGDRILRIECHGCQPEEYLVSNTNWGKLRFAYDLDAP